MTAKLPGQFAKILLIILFFTLKQFFFILNDFLNNGGYNKQQQNKITTEMCKDFSFKVVFNGCCSLA